MAAFINTSSSPHVVWTTIHVRKSGITFSNLRDSIASCRLNVAQPITSEGISVGRFQIASGTSDWRPPRQCLLCPAKSEGPRLSVRQKCRRKHSKTPERNGIDERQSTRTLSDRADRTSGTYLHRWCRSTSRWERIGLWIFASRHRGKASHSRGRFDQQSGGVQGHYPGSRNFACGQHRTDLYRLRTDMRATQRSVSRA